MSLDSHDEAIFRRMSGRDSGPRACSRASPRRRRAGLAPIKINCVVQRGVNDHAIVELARRFRGTGHIVRFIEFMDVGTLNHWDLAQVVTAREIIERIGAELPARAARAELRGRGRRALALSRRRAARSA